MDDLENSASFVRSVLSGDTIGDTAYSQRFVLKTLIRLVKLEEMDRVSEFLENNLSVVWKMSAEKDVAKFLTKHSGIEIFCHTLMVSNNDSLTEAILGIMVNMCCFPEIVCELHKKDYAIRSVLRYLSSEDPLIIVQVMRFIFRNIYYDPTHYDPWLQHFELNNFTVILKFILCNSANEEVLTSTFEAMNCIFSLLEGKCDRNKFVRLFIDKELVQAIRLGYEEYSSSVGESGNEEALEKCETTFMSVYDALTSYDALSSDAFEDEMPEILKILTYILTRHIKRNSDCLVDIVEYVLTILSVSNHVYATEGEGMFNNMAKLWVGACESNIDKSSFENFDSTEALKNEELLNVLPQYFVRFVISNPREQTFKVFKFFQRQQLSLLYEKVKELISSGKMDPYYSNVCPTLYALVTPD